MSLDELIFFGAVLIFSVTSILSSSIFYKRISRAKEVFNDSRDLLSTVLLPFNKQQQNIENSLSSALYDIERVRAQVENVFEHISQQAGDPIKTDYLALETITKKLVEQITQLQNSQKTLWEQVKKIESQPSQRSRPELDTKHVQAIKLTKTEKKILEVLYTDGSKTAPEIEDIIQKTREHTSRLMKKLWVAGYIEREVHIIPYMYRPTRKLIERFKNVH